MNPLDHAAPASRPETARTSGAGFLRSLPAFAVAALLVPAFTATPAHAAGKNGKNDVVLRAANVTKPRRATLRMYDSSQASVRANYTRSVSNRPGHETLFAAYPFRLTVEKSGRVIANWQRQGGGSYLLRSSAAPARRYEVYFACDSSADVWRLRVNGKTDVAPAYGHCLADTWGQAYIGGATLRNKPIRGKLDLVVSVSDADGDGQRQAARNPDRKPDRKPSKPSRPSKPAKPSKQGSAVVVADHSERNFSDWPNSGMVAGGKKPWSQQVVEWNGQQVARFEVREGQAGPRTKVRSEVGDVSVKLGEEWWYSWRTLIPNEWKDNDSTWYIVTQFHQAPPKWRRGDWGPPPLKFGYSGGKWSIQHWFYDEDHPRKPIYEAAGRKGEWVDWRVHAKWSGGPDGLLQVWRDGKLVVNRHGKNINGDGGGGPFFKLGIYRGYGDPNTQVIYHDEYRRGRTAAAVR